MATKQSLETMNKVTRSLDIGTQQGTCRVEVITLGVVDERARQSCVELRLERGTQILIIDICQKLLVDTLNINPVDIYRTKYKR